MVIASFFSENEKHDFVVSGAFDCSSIFLCLGWVEFEFNRFKKVFDSVGQSEYHNITKYVSKIKKLKPYSLFHRNWDYHGCLPKVTQSLKSKIFNWKLKIKKLVSRSGTGVISGSWAA